MQEPVESGDAGERDNRVATAALLAPFDRDVLLATGRVVQVRAAHAGDVDHLRSFYRQLGDTSTHYRFFGIRRSIPDAELERATVQDIRRQVTLVTEADGVVIGVGEFHALPNGEEAEVAFAVADAHHHEGVATVLLEDLALVARTAGFQRLIAETLADNAAMLGVFRSVGLVHRTWFEDGVIHVQLDLTADHLLQDDADLRDWRSVVRSLRSLVEPSHVVVIAVGRDPTSPGGRILAHLRDSFNGTVSVVHPTEATIDGVDAVAALDALDEVPELAIIAMPASAVADVVNDCGSAGIPTAVIISAGFAEVGSEGVRLQDEVVATARRHGMRLVGPSSLGVVSTSCGLNATFTRQEFVPGGIAIASQSGGVGVAIAAEAQRRHAGVSSFVSMGNKADVSGNDLLRLWADDDSTNVILLYLESFGDPVRFARVARAVSRQKPIIALKSGGTTPGSRGTQSHTAALASDQVVVDALFAHTGVVRARTLEELIDVGVLLDRQPAPAGTRVALIGNSGGPLTLGVDAAAAAHLAVPVLSSNLQDELTDIAPAAVSTFNPIDLGSGASPDQLVAVARAIGQSGEVDGCIVVCVDVGERGDLQRVGSLLGALELDGVALALSLIGTGDDSVAGGAPVFPTPERATTAIALAAKWSAWNASMSQDVAADDPTVLDANSFTDSRRIARVHAAGSTVTKWLSPADSLELLEAALIPIAPRRSGPAAEQSADQVELLIGAMRDSTFGPFVVVGAGGVETELRDDRVMLVAPVSKSAARVAVESLRLAPLFHGFRGRPGLPVDSVVDLVHRVGMLAASVPEIQQLDMNPVLVDASGCVAIDALVGVAVPPSPVVPARSMRRRTAPPRPT